MNTGFNESNLVAKLIEGDRKAQAHTYEMFHTEMLHFCIAYVKVREDAEELMMDGFRICFNDISRIRSTEVTNLRYWLRGMFRHLCIRFASKKKQELIELAVDHDVGCEATQIMQMTVEELLSVVKCLPEIQEKVFSYFVLEELSHREIADILDITIENSEVLLYRARTKLKEKVTYLYQIGKKNEKGTRK